MECADAPDEEDPCPDPPPHPQFEKMRRDIKKIWDDHAREMARMKNFSQVKETVDKNIADNKKKLH